MKSRSPCAVVMAFGVLTLGAGPSGAQTAPPTATAAQNAARVPATLSRPTGRFGRTLGLPKDGKDLYIADEDYIRFPLPRRAGLCRRRREEDQGDDRRDHRDLAQEP